MKKTDFYWTPPVLNLDTATSSDMPGDTVRINESHIRRADTVFPFVLEYFSSSEVERIVISVFGGSGAGKSEIGSILAAYCIDAGYPAYLMSGDNYPRRCPPQNDVERLNRFRYEGLAAISIDENFSDNWVSEIRATWPAMADSDMDRALQIGYFSIYQSAGKSALKEYLGTEQEIDYSLVNSIIERFKSGNNRIPLKRMGRTDSDIFFESVDFTNIRVLILEWTHGNNSRLHGVDFPIYLYSSPEETLKHRKARGRDKNTDSAFTKLVLEIEQAELNAQASEAAVIVGKDGSLISNLVFTEVEE